MPTIALEVWYRSLEWENRNLDRLYTERLALVNEANDVMAILRIDEQIKKSERAVAVLERNIELQGIEDRNRGEGRQWI